MGPTHPSGAPWNVERQLVQLICSPAVVWRGRARQDPAVLQPLPERVVLLAVGAPRLQEQVLQKKLPHEVADLFAVVLTLADARQLCSIAAEKVMGCGY